MYLTTLKAYRAKCQQMGVEMTFEGAREFALAWKEINHV